MTDQKCIFKFRYKDECHDSEKTQSNQGPDRIIKIIDASNQYGDGLSDNLNQALASSPNSSCLIIRNVYRTIQQNKFS